MPRRELLLDLRQRRLQRRRGHRHRRGHRGVLQGSRRGTLLRPREPAAQSARIATANDQSLMRSRATKKPSRGHSAKEIAKIRVLLSALDPTLALAHAAADPFEWRVNEAGFAGLARIIVGQQVSTASANSIWSRFKAGVGAGIGELSARAVMAH